jgi:hypothetical protein
MVPLGRGKPALASALTTRKNPMLERVGAEPLNPAPGAEEGSLTSVQGSDAFHPARSYLNAA